MAQNDQTILSGASVLANHLGWAGLGWLGAVIFPACVAGFDRQQGILEYASLPNVGVCGVTAHIHYVVHPQGGPREICDCYNKMRITRAAFQCCMKL